MLVLSRKVGEEIHVPGCNLVFTILEIKGGRARVGVSAPAGVQVYRQEVWARVQAEGEHAETAGCPG